MTEDFLAPQNSQLSNIFSGDTVNSDSTFKYKKNKKPKHNSTSGSGSKLLYSCTVKAYKCVNNQNVSQGNLGAAILFNANHFEFSLLLYVSKQQQILTCKITPSFTLNVPQDSYVGFYDDTNTLWYLLFDNDPDLRKFIGQFLIAKASVTNNNKQIEVFYIDMKSSSGKLVKDDSSLNVQYSGFLVENLKVGREFDSSNSFAIKLGRSNLIKGWIPSVIGMSVGSARVVFIPYSQAYGEKGVHGQIPPHTDLVFHITVNSIGDSSSIHKKPQSDSQPPLPTLAKLSDEEDDDYEGVSNGSNEEYSDQTKIISRMAKLGQPVFGRGMSESDDARHDAESVSSSEKSERTKVTRSEKPREPPQTSSYQPLASDLVQNSLATQSMPVMAPPGPVALYQPQQPIYQPQTVPYMPQVAAPMVAPTPQYVPTAPQPDIRSELSLMESKQLQMDTKSQLQQLSVKVDDIHKKVDQLSSNNSAIVSSQSSMVTMESSSVLENIARIIKENDTLKRKLYEQQSLVDSQTDKIASLLGQNQKFLEHSNVMLEQRNESFQNVAATSQSKITGLEQEKAQLMTDLNAQKNKVNSLQYDIMTLQQRENELKTQTQSAYNDKNNLEQLSIQLKAQIKELEADVSTLKSTFKEEKGSRKTAENRCTELDDQIADLQSEISTHKKTIRSAKKKLEKQKNEFENELEEVKSSHDNEVKDLMVRLKRQKQSGNEASEQLAAMELELNEKWRKKLDKSQSDLRSKYEEMLEELRDAIEDKNIAIRGYEKEVQSRNAAYHSVSKEKAELERAIDELNVQLQAKLAAPAPPPASPDLLQEMKKLMNKVYHTLVKQIDSNNSYAGSQVLQILRSTIKEVTLSMSSGDAPLAKPPVEEQAPPPAPIPSSDASDDSSDDDNISLDNISSGSSSDSESEKASVDHQRDEVEVNIIEDENVHKADENIVDKVTDDEVIKKVEDDVQTLELVNDEPEALKSEDIGHNDTSDSSVVSNDSIEVNAKINTDVKSDSESSIDSHSLKSEKDPVQLQEDDSAQLHHNIPPIIITKDEADGQKSPEVDNDLKKEVFEGSYYTSEEDNDAPVGNPLEEGKQMNEGNASIENTVPDTPTSVEQKNNSLSKIFDSDNDDDDDPNSMFSVKAPRRTSTPQTSPVETKRPSVFEESTDANLMKDVFGESMKQSEEPTKPNIPAPLFGDDSDDDDSWLK